MITINPPKIECIPKNEIDHKELNMSCTQNIRIAYFTVLLSNPFFHIKNTEIPIKK